MPIFKEFAQITRNPAVAQKNFASTKVEWQQKFYKELIYQFLEEAT